MTCKYYLVEPLKYIFSIAPYLYFIPIPLMDKGLITNEYDFTNDM